jgi:hypothetical protein
VSKIFKSPFKLTATVDFPGETTYGVFTTDLLKQFIQSLKSAGVTRINWIYYGDISDDSFWAGSIFSNTTYGLETLSLIGEPLSAAVPIAHSMGMEIYGVLKPYNTGGSATIPDGVAQKPDLFLPRVGGKLTQFIPFIKRYPEKRIQRFNYHEVKGPIEFIRLYKSDDRETRISKDNIQIWISNNNYEYRLLETDFNFKQFSEPAEKDVCDYYGEILTKKNNYVRVIELNGFRIQENFCVITTNLTGQGDFNNSACEMIKVYNSNMKEIPVSVATRSDIWNYNRNFETNGLEYDSGWGSFKYTLDTNNDSSKCDFFWSDLPAHGVIGIARDKNRFLPTAPCEVYPEVKKLWLGWIRNILSTGVDGVDIRVSAHGTLTDEPYSYGFNSPILEEYHNKFGDENLDLLKVSSIRGEHFTNFIRTASLMTRNLGKKMQVHIHTEIFRDNPSPGQIMGCPVNIFFDYQKWFDENLIDLVTLRSSWFEGLEDPPESDSYRSKLDYIFADDVFKNAINLCIENKSDIFLNRYIGRAVKFDEYLDDLERVYHDSRFAGFDLYESMDLIRSNGSTGSLVQVEDKLDRIKCKLNKLDLI